MSDPAKRPTMEYASIGTMDVLTDEARRDVLIAFQGDPNEEEYDLAVRLSEANVPALAVLLHKAAKELDNTARDMTAAGQVLNVTEVHALEPSMGQYAIQLGFLGFQVPLAMSKQMALNLIAELHKALEERPSQRGRLS